MFFVLSYLQVLRENEFRLNMTSMPLQIISAKNKKFSNVIAGLGLISFHKNVEKKLYSIMRLYFLILLANFGIEGSAMIYLEI